LNRDDDYTRDLRGWFALAALTVFLLTIAGTLVLLATGRWTEGKEFLGLVLPVEAGILFAASRYYFGGRKLK